MTKIIKNVDIRDKKEFKKVIKEQRKNANNIINESDKFVLFAEEGDMVFAPFPDMCRILCTGIIKLIKNDILDKSVVRDIMEIALSEDPSKKIDELIKEKEEK